MFTLKVPGEPAILKQVTYFYRFSKMWTQCIGKHAYAENQELDLF